MKPLMALFIALLLYVWMDILLWQRIFEANEMWEFAGVYHNGWFVALYGYILLGILLLDGWRNKLFFGSSLFVLAFNGTNDVLYYWLDGRTLPAVLPWLDAHPLILFSPVTAENLIINCAAWLVAVGGFYAATRYKGRLDVAK